MKSNSTRPPPQEGSRAVKLVVVGDDGEGKTSLVAAYAEKRFLNDDERKDIYDVFSVGVDIEGKAIDFQVNDTVGEEGYDRLRPLIYPGTHVMILVYSAGSPDSLRNVQSKWLPEIDHHAIRVPPLVLVANKADLRGDHDKETLVTTEQGKKVARKIGAEYLECSAKTGEGVEAVFDLACRLGVWESDRPTLRPICRGGPCII